MFLMESYNRGILPEIDAGFILTLNVPDMINIQRKLDPYRIEMVSYSGVKSIHELDDGLKFNSSGRKIVSLIEPVNYPNKHQEPAFRSTRTTEHIPFRIAECYSFLTSDNKIRVLLPTKPIECLYSFTIKYPKKGDVSVIYFIFHDDIDGVILPYISSNLEMILKRVVNVQSLEAKRIARGFINNVRKFPVVLN